jgi:hypothetical protein
VKEKALPSHGTYVCVFEAGSFIKRQYSTIGVFAAVALVPIAVFLET